jgi:hypothetical protein
MLPIRIIPVQKDNNEIGGMLIIGLRSKNIPLEFIDKIMMIMRCQYENHLTL